MDFVRQKQKTQNTSNEHGFTLIELVIVIIILGILLTVVATAYRGVRAKNRNNQRETNITALQGSLESYYAETSMYPTLSELNDASWVSRNMPDLPSGILQDPSWKAASACTADGHSIVIGHPAADCYSYQVIATDGSACDNVKKICAHYTLTAELEGGSKFVKSSL